MCVERRSINTITGESRAQTTIHPGCAELLGDFSPAIIQVMCDVLGKGGQLSFDSDTTGLLVAISNGDGELDLVPDFKKGISFGENEVVFIGSKNSDTGFSFTYGSRTNEVLRYFHREVEK